MSEPKYRLLAGQLRVRISQGLPPGTRMPSENELAQNTGYSRQTVRQAISLLEREGLVQRVQGSGTFVRSTAPRREPTHNIAVVTTYIGEYIFPDILHGIDLELDKQGYTPLLAATRNRVENERRILEGLLEKPIDGLIVEGTKTALPNPNIDLYDRFAQKGIPVVFINGFYPDLRSPLYVVADDRAGGEMACGLLLEQGCRRIAGIFKNDDIQGHRRYAGYAQALRKAGLPVRDDDLLWYATESRDAQLEHQALAVAEGCDGLVCYNDEVAVKLLALFAAAGVAPPRLVSFDKSTYARLSAQPFVSLCSPKERLGALAAAKLLGVLAGQAEKPAVLPWRLEEDPAL